MRRVWLPAIGRSSTYENSHPSHLTRDARMSALTRNPSTRSRRDLVSTLSLRSGARSDFTRSSSKSLDSNSFDCAAKSARLTVTKVGELSNNEAPGWHLDRAYGWRAAGPWPSAQRPAPAEGSRRSRRWNIFPGAPASHRQRCVMLKTGACAAIAVGTFFPVLRHRTVRGVLF